MIMISDDDLGRLKSARDAVQDIAECSTTPVHTSWAQKAVWLLNTVLSNADRLQAPHVPAEPYAEVSVHPV